MSFMNAPKLSLASLVSLLLTVSSPSAVAYTGAGSGILRAQLCSSPAELLRAARGGDVESMRILGKMLIEGNGVKRDVKNGVKWIKMAAEQGDSGAMLIMGDLYRKGFGVPQDMNKAVEYYILADENGNKNAAKRIDKLSLKESLPYWEKKVADGNKKATIKLMLAHATGDGIPKDLDKAKDLYELAKKKWPKAAEKALADLTEEQRTALLPPPPKEEPVVHDDTDDSDNSIVHRWTYNRIDSEYYTITDREETESNYRLCMTNANAALSKLPGLVNDMMGLLSTCDAVSAFAQAEMFRLTLMSKYNVSAEQISRKYGYLISEYKAHVIAAIKCASDNPGAICAEKYNVMAAILTEGYDGKCSDSLMKKAFVDFCESYLLAADAYLSVVKSAADVSDSDKALYAVIGYISLKRYLKATRPKFVDIADSKYYSDYILKVVMHCRRIKRAGYYGSSAIQESVDFILSR